MENIFNHDQTSLMAWCVSQGEPAYRAKQLLQWIHQHGVTDFDAMLNISKGFRARLKNVACIQPPDIARTWHSADGTVKWLMRLDDHNHVETVYIPEKERGTLCISSQIGCALKCDFCATGDQGFARNLSVAEIIGQLWVANQQLRASLGRERPISNVVFMGMGEPLLNYDAVLATTRLMLDDHAYGLSKYRVTISTSGIVPAMRQLAKDSPVSLAVSLHAPTDPLRDQLVPINRRYPLAELMDVCQTYFTAESKRYVTIEYVMLKDVNDQRTHAKALIKCLHGVPSKVNLIPFNSYDGGRYERSSEETIQTFQRILSRAGINTIVRRTRGDDVSAACGQLEGLFQDQTLRTAAGRAWQLKRRAQQKRTQASRAAA